MCRPCRLQYLHQLAVLFGHRYHLVHHLLVEHLLDEHLRYLGHLRHLDLRCLQLLESGLSDFSLVFLADFSFLVCEPKRSSFL